MKENQDIQQQSIVKKHNRKLRFAYTNYTGCTGCGQVGASVAFTLVQSGLFSEPVLIDINQQKSVGIKIQGRNSEDLLKDD